MSSLGGVFYDGVRLVSEAAYSSSTAGFHVGVADVVALRALASHNNIDLIGVQQPLPGTMFMFDATSMLVDDGVSVIKPTDIPLASPGRWLSITAAVSASSFTGLVDTPAGVIPADVSVISSVGGGALVYLKNNLTAIVAPTVNDDSGAGYAVGSTWVDTVGGSVWRCVDATAAAAVWKDLSASGGAVTTQTLEVPFAFNTPSPLTIRSMVAGETVVNAEIQINTIFDGASLLELGTVATPGLIIPVANNIPGAVGVYRNDVNFPFSAPGTIRLTITPGTSTQGAGLVVMQIKL